MNRTVEKNGGGYVDECLYCTSCTDSAQGCRETCEYYCSIDLQERREDEYFQMLQWQREEYQITEKELEN